MKNLFLTIPALALASGCLVYDNDGQIGPDRDRDRPDLTEDSASGELDPVVNFEFTPPQAEQGEVFIGSLSVAEGDLDLSTVESVTVYGDADILAIDARPGEVLLSVAVAGDALSSEADFVVEFSDGTAAWMEAAFVISEMGSGGAADDYTGDTNPTDDSEEDPCT